MLAGTDARTAKQRERRRHRYALGEFLHEHSSVPRVRRCGFRRSSVRSDVAVKVADGVGHFSGLQLCGSISACPVCGAKIRERRASEIRQAGDRWLSDDELVLKRPAGKGLVTLPVGRSLLFLTLTMPHDAGDALEATWDTIGDGWRHLLSGRQGQALGSTFGVVGKVTAREVTWSPANGWHPHLHVLLFLDRVLEDDELVALRGNLFSRWSKFMTMRGWRAPHERFGVDLQRVEQAGALGDYLVKATGVGGDEWGVGRELTRADLKRGSSGSVTPWELLGLAMRDGDCGALGLWQTWERVARGRQIITWSAGLKACVSVVELTDDEVVDEDQGGEVVAMIGRPLWAWVCRQRGVRAGILDAAPRGFMAVRQVLVEAGASDLVGSLRRPSDEGG